MKFVLVRLRCGNKSASGGRKALFTIEAGKDTFRITQGMYHGEVLPGGYEATGPEGKSQGRAPYFRQTFSGHITRAFGTL